MSKDDAELIANFCGATGVLDLLRESRDLSSYMVGVEVGMDTNARKNRSGAFMERHLEPLIRSAAGPSSGWRVFGHPSPAKLKQAGIPVPQGLSARTFDYALIGNSRMIAIETNFYDKLGSKPQEVVDAYIQRAHEFRDASWEFVWVTDGPAWKSGPSQLQKAFDELDAILNLSFAGRGVFHSILGTGPDSGARSPRWASPS